MDHLTRKANDFMQQYSFHRIIRRREIVCVPVIFSQKLHGTIMPDQRVFIS